jgi:hypothetical protein
MAEVHPGHMLTGSKEEEEEYPNKFTSRGEIAITI